MGGNDDTNNDASSKVRNAAVSTATTATNNVSSKEEDKMGVQHNLLGKGMIQLTDVINDNLIVCRYGFFATVAVLTVYSVANTPLFFRFRTTSDIPSSWFVHRRTLRGRVVRIVDNNNHKNNNTSTAATTTSTTRRKKPIVCMVRHLSPMGSLLSKSWFDFLLKSNPTSSFSSYDQNDNDLMKVEIAGIQEPPPHYHDSGEWLQKFAHDRTIVSCKLLARRVVLVADNQDTTTRTTDVYQRTKKRKLKPSNFDPKNKYNNERHLEDPRNNDNHSDKYADHDDDDDIVDQIAVCKLYYRPNNNNSTSSISSIISNLLFPKDVAETVVRLGHANAHGSDDSNDSASDDDFDGLYHSYTTSTTIDKIKDSASDVRKLQDDVQYIEKLHRAELSAAEKLRGMWRQEIVRKNKKGIMDEIELRVFEKNLPVWKKVYRYFFP